MANGAYLSLLWGFTLMLGVKSGYDSSAFVRYHNFYRARESLAVSMKTMQWDWYIARQAYLWASRCIWAHSPRKLRETNKYSYLGENMYYTTSSKADPGKVVRSWYSEKAYYNYRSNSCRSGKSCGHYTQVVWAKSEALGCYSQKCYSLKKSLTSSTKRLKNPVYLVVCMYGPGGNYKGQRPYEINSGSGCSCKRDDIHDKKDNDNEELQQLDSALSDISEDLFISDRSTSDESPEVKNVDTLIEEDDSFQSGPSVIENDDSEKENVDDMISRLAKAIIDGDK